MIDQFELFQPPGWARNPHFQTIIANRKIRSLGSNLMASVALETVIDAGNDIRLQGFHSFHLENGGKGLAILVHGWEGSAESTYIKALGKVVFQQGYDVFRLNMRDHGSSHHLNPGLFNGTLSEEFFQAVKNIAAMAAPPNCFLIGFSLGGNFALRFGLHAEVASVGNLQRIIGISPCMDPYKTTCALDRQAFYRWYFLRKWRRSLMKKESIFPELYDFSRVFAGHNCLEMTRLMIEQYTDMSGYEEYFEQYTLTGGVLEDLTVPVTIITAADDPLVPVEDFYDLPDIDCLELLIQRYGGHCGFIDQVPSGCWHERKVCELLAEIEKKEAQNA